MQHVPSLISAFVIVCHNVVACLYIQGHTPLHYAAGDNRAAAIEALVKAGADTNKANNDVSTHAHARPHA